MKLVCSECGHKARDSYNLERHKKRNHAPPSTFECFNCDSQFRYKGQMARHMKKCGLSSSTSISSHQCPLCSSKFSDRQIIADHLSRAHDLKLKKQFLSFATEDEFVEWKNNEEISTHASFVVYSNFTHRSGEKTIYFECSRSGHGMVKALDSRKRRPSFRGTPKTGTFCPARISKKTSIDGRIDVDYTNLHVGHDFDVSRLRLQKSYRKHLAEQIRMKIPFSEILANEIEIALQNNRGQLDRKMFLTLADLHNVARDFGINEEASLCQNDAMSEDLSEMNEDSDSECMIYFEPDENAVKEEAICFEILPEPSPFDEMTKNEEIRKLVQDFEETLHRTVSSRGQLEAARDTIETLKAALIATSELEPDE